MDYAYIAEIETWGSGDQMLDVLTLQDGKILLITEQRVVLYESRSAFDSGTGGKIISRV